MAINAQGFDEAATVKFSPGKPGGLGALSSSVDPKISGETLQLQTTASVMTATTPGGKESQGREMEGGGGFTAQRHWYCQDPGAQCCHQQYPEGSMNEQSIKTERKGNGRNYDELKFRFLNNTISAK